MATTLLQPFRRSIARLNMAIDRATAQYCGPAYVPAGSKAPIAIWARQQAISGLAPIATELVRDGRAWGFDVQLENLSRRTQGVT